MRVVADTEAGEDKFSALILAVVQSFPFQNQRVERVAPNTLAESPGNALGATRSTSATVEQ